MSKNTLFIIRARKFDKLARILAERLTEVDEPVVLVIDERNDTSDSSPHYKISLNNNILTRLGFTGLPEDWGWFCGDLCYFVAEDVFPNYERYCLIESDVYLPLKSVKPLVAAVCRPPADALAAQLGPSAGPKRFSRDLAKLGLDPAWGCIFPVSSISAELLFAMKALRLESLKLHPDARLNDEAILAGAIQRGNFTYAALETVLPQHVSRRCFHTNPPHLFEAIAPRSEELRLFHPVITSDTAFERIATGEKNYSEHRLRRVLRTAPDPLKSKLIEALAAQPTSGKAIK
ncbi:MAG: hypothetical protein ACSHXW_03035 [Yoonia sp.]